MREQRTRAGAAQRAKRGRHLPSLAFSHTRGHLRVSRFARRTTERETARSLIITVIKLVSKNVEERPFYERKRALR